MSRLSAGERDAIRRVLIYRLGSLGDTVTVLSAFHLVARTFPNAERRVLTNFPVSSLAAPVETILNGSNLAHGYIEYPLHLRSLRALWRLRREIRAFGPDILVYMREARSVKTVLRDRLFFRLCGIPRIIGASLSRDLLFPRQSPETGLTESVTTRMARNLAELGDSRLDDPASHDLCFTDDERRAADSLVADWPGRQNFIAVAIGTKQKHKDWGAENWRAVLETVGARCPDLGLMLIGAKEEAVLSGETAAGWVGPVLNLCGAVSPRLSALAMAPARLFIGVDSGPMHLAANAGIPVIALFSPVSPPGLWFPWGDGHHIFYPGREPAGGNPADGIAAIHPEAVIEACDALLSKSGSQA